MRNEEAVLRGGLFLKGLKGDCHLFIGKTSYG
jgi:hypothetical protein